MKKILFAYLLLSSLTVDGQITSTTNRDETNIYFHAVDSAIHLILAESKPQAIILEGDLDVINHLPDSVAGLRTIVKGAQKIRIPNDVATIKIYRFSVDNGEFTIPMIILTRNGLLNGRPTYFFIYEFVSSDKTFRLLRIDKSVIIR